jgi:hypothetical protein
MPQASPGQLTQLAAAVSAGGIRHALGHMALATAVAMPSYLAALLYLG